MNTLIWIMQGALAIIFLLAGGMKLILSKEKLLKQQGLESGTSVLPQRLLGFVELLGVVGIIFPLLCGFSPILTPLAATGFAMTMVGAIFVHVKKKNVKGIILPSITLILSIIVACYRFINL